MENNMAFNVNTRRESM